ncbi:MAG TPA: hypothetical protein GX708_23360 [Gallicola sp.]|nr:hypothetical protein [Gallicola sp.]
MIIDYPKNLIKKLLDLDQDKKYEIKEHKKKRSLDANAYYWSLINQLANKLNLGNEELHRKMLQDYSQVMIVPLTPLQNPKGYFKYYEEYQKGKIKGQEIIQYKVYLPSSEMNSKEFWHLLQGLENECREQGIETLEERKVREMIERMENKEVLK